MLEGTCTEIQYDRGTDGMLRERCRNDYATGSVCGSYDADIHVIRNDQPGQNLVTLHIYTPPMETFHVYSLEDPGVKVVTDRESVGAMQLRRQRIEAGSV